MPGWNSGRWLLALLAGVTLCVPAPEPSPKRPRLGVIYTETTEFDATAWTRSAERFPAGAQIKVVSAGVPRLIAPGFAATADPALSFDARELLFSAKQRPADAWQIWRVPLAGGAPAKLTQSPDDCIRPIPTPGGAVVYARRRDGRFQLEILRPGAAPLPISFLPGATVPAQVLRDGRILFEAVDHPGHIELYTVYDNGSGVESLRCDHHEDHRDARQTASGDIVFTTRNGLARFTSGATRAVPLPSPSGEIAGPVAELSTGEWLLSLRATAAAPAHLHRWRPGTAPVRELTNAVQPVVIAPRDVPPAHPSALHNRPAGVLLCLNAYESPLRFPAGSVAAVRLLTESGPLGETPVESDGSFYVQVPSERPLRFELLDASGQTLAAQKNWFWMRRGEQRACVGCHAGPERAPENIVPKILTRLLQPVPLMKETPR
ncbi:MAG: hypothetical protein SFV54_18665 [Bryobacteraceae bacterium]|nr:hypothetical protein [Bryobacteraceae bacterium]